MRAAHALLILTLATAPWGAMGCPRPAACEGTCTPCNDEEGCPTFESCTEGRCQAALDAGRVDAGHAAAGDAGSDAGGTADAGAALDAGFAQDGGGADGGGADGGGADGGGADDAGTNDDAGPASDAGVLDDAGRATDAGVLDDAGADAGFVVDAGHLEPPWWDPAWGLRRPVTVAAGARALAAGTPVRLVVDHASLVSAGLAREDGNDLRIVRWTGAAWLELPRVPAEGSPLATATTTLVFRVPDDVATANVDADTYLYFAAPSAGPPPLDNVPPALVVQQRQAPEAYTDQTTPVTQSTLALTGLAAADVWIVVATWGQHADDVGTAFRAGHARLLVDDVPVPGLTALTFRQAGQVDKRMGTFFVLNGATGSRTIALQIAAESAGRSAGMSASRIVAFRLPDPARSDLHVDARPELVVDTDPQVIASTLSFTPSSAGRYLWMVRGSHREGPGATNGSLVAVDELGASAQSTDETYIDNDNIGYVPLFHVEVRDLTATPQTFVVRHDANADGAERQGVLQLVFRADVFADVEHAAAVAISTEESPGAKVTMTTQSTATAADRVVLGVVGHKQTVLDVTLASSIQLEIDGAYDSEDVVRIDRAGYDTIFPIALAERGASGREFAVFVNADPEMDVEARRAHLVALRWHEPVVTLGDVEAF